MSSKLTLLLPDPELASLHLMGSLAPLLSQWGCGFPRGSPAPIRAPFPACAPGCWMEPGVPRLGTDCTAHCARMHLPGCTHSLPRPAPCRLQLSGFHSHRHPTSSLPSGHGEPRVGVRATEPLHMPFSPPRTLFLAQRPEGLRAVVTLSVELSLTLCVMARF